MTQRRQQGAYEDLIQLGDAPPAYDDALGSPGSAPAVPPRSRPMSYTAPAPTRHNMSAASSSNASLGRNNTMPHGGRVPTPNFGQAPQQSYAPPPGPPGPARQSSTSSSSYLPPSHPPPAPASGLQRSTSIEDEFAPLKRYKVCIIVDDSPSMHELWNQLGEVLFAVGETCLRYSGQEGIDMYFLNAIHAHAVGIQSAGQLRQAFHAVQLSGSTPTALVLDDVLRPYVELVEDARASPAIQRPKPMIVLVLTDGRADDTDGVKDIVVEMAQRLDEARAPPHQLGIQFLQLGNDPDVAKWFRELDDDLKAEAGVRDMVDTAPYAGALTPDFMLNALLGSVVRRLDNRSA